MALNNQQEIIERSLFEVVRLKAISEGLTPDITTFDNSPSGFSAYQAALQSMYETNGIAVEIFSNVPNEDAGYKKVPRIIFKSESFLPGEYGMDPSPQTVWNEAEQRFDREVHDNLSYQMFINCHLVANTVSDMRTLIALMHASIPVRGQIPIYNSQSLTFFIEINNFFNISSADDGINENIYRYNIPDIIWNEPLITATELATIADASINILFLTHSGLSINIVQ